MENPIEIKLISKKDVPPSELISYAANGCYNPKEPSLGKKINIKEKLFEKGHQTTLQHSDFTFFTEGVSVYDITFGLHLANVHYNTSQRSGRFCGEMFDNPDFNQIQNYICFHYGLAPYEISAVMEFIKFGIEIYRENIGKAAEIAGKLIKEERPLTSEKYIENNAPKFAQEQLRMFIPTVFPTAATFTVNLSAITAMYYSAFSPSMKNIMNQIKREILNLYPELEYMFIERNVYPESQVKWMTSSEEHFLNSEINTLLHKPELHLFPLSNTIISDYIIPKEEDMHPIDALPFLPELMDNNVNEIKTRVKMSLATIGQDQRHRTIRRSQPRFTGQFYIPPIVKMLELENKALEILKLWASFNKTNLPKSLINLISPYGNMVEYIKSSPLNALFHEQNKRSCWCAQEEIYHLALILRNAITLEDPKYHNLLKILAPKCIEKRSCAEGDRYCGRNMKNSPFIERRI